MSVPDFVSHVVTDRTALAAGYLEHASHQSMSAYLADWEQAQRRLARQIVNLRDARDARKADTEAGLWPPRRVVEGSESQVAPGLPAGGERSAPSTVSDLCAALQESLDVAKAEIAERHNDDLSES